MKILFLGCDKFALIPLRHLHQEGWVKAVITRKEKIKGRGRKIEQTAVGREAKKLNILYYEVENLRGFQEHFLNEVDMLVCVAFGLRIPPEFINRFPLGEINLHPSLLPYYRGAAPIRRVIMEGKTLTGVTVHTVSLNYDEGEILSQLEVTINDDDNYSSLSQKLAEIGAKLLIETIKKIEKSAIKVEPQDHSQATYAARIEKEERYINWSKNAKDIVNLVRALSYQPGAIARYNKEEWKILSARALTGDKNLSEVENSKLPAKPGYFLVTQDRLIVKSGEGWVEILEVQRPGKKALSIASFLKGFRETERFFLSE
ncbi:MAG: Methionyl-tRNA formyltransferase [candidate division WS2 bacterium]|nr:Methionyl-tRNA formyltransferase [Candidatus Lithacetigena glycinireducens]